MWFASQKTTLSGLFERDIPGKVALSLSFLQVSLTLTEPANIVITITAVSLFIAQPYSLAVQGSFSGPLASDTNPAYTVGSALSCTEPVVRLESFPAKYTNQQTADFRFRADTCTSSLTKPLSRVLQMMQKMSSHRFQDSVQMGLHSAWKQRLALHILSQTSVWITIQPFLVGEGKPGWGKVKGEVTFGVW